MVLAIIALVGFRPFFLTAIATIVIGGALLAHGAATTTRWNEKGWRNELAGGMGIEVLAGAAAVLFGIIVLAHVSPLVFLPVAAIVLGGALLMAAPSQSQLARFERDLDTGVERAIYRGTQATTPLMTFAGAAAVVLGILGLIHVGSAATLAMVAILVLGGTLFLSGSALSARYGRRMRHAH